MRAFAALAVAVLAAGTACGGGRGSDKSAPKRAITPDAQQQAASIVLRLSDFPEGWRASTPSAEDVAGQKKFRKCLGSDYSKITLTGDARSKNFAIGESTSVTSEAQVTRSAAQAKDRFQQTAKRLEGPAITDCFREAIGKIPGGDYKIGEVDVGELRTSLPPNVDAAKAWEIVIPVEVTSGAGKGQSASVYLDAVFLRKGKVVANVQTSDVLSPVNSGLRTKLVQTVARRMSESST